MNKSICISILILILFSCTVVSGESHNLSDLIGKSVSIIYYDWDVTATQSGTITDYYLYGDKLFLNVSYDDGSYHVINFNYIYEITDQ